MKNNLINNKRVLIFFCFLGWSATTLISCKENTILPPSAVPVVDNINTFQTDTFTIISRTTYQDSILTGGKSGTINKATQTDFYHAIGLITMDPTFGKTVASSYFQVVPPVANFVFQGSGQIIDSVVLSVPYVNAYGDTNMTSNQTYALYRTADNLTQDSAYYESNTVNYSASNKVANDILVDLSTLSTDSPLVGTVRVIPQLRFNLNQSFRDSLLAQSSSGAFLNYTSFLEWFGGFYIAPADTMGSGAGMGYFDTYNANFTIYYRTTINSVLDTIQTVFKFNPTYCNRFNRITRNYTNATTVLPYINNTNATGDSIVFVEGEPGLAAEISFPFLGQFPNAIINKAELSFTVISPYQNYGDTINYNIPERLQIIYVNEDGEDEILEDYVQLGAAWVGGFRKFYNINGANFIQYRFNLSHAIQNAIIRQNSNFKLKVSGVRSNFPAIHRTIIAGATRTNAAEKMKLNIIYTKIQ
jgi:hypothetical protein